MKKFLKNAIALLCIGCVTISGSGCFLFELVLDRLLSHEHVYGESNDPSVLRACTYEGCTAGIMPETESAYKKQIVYTFDKADKIRLEQQHQALLDELEEVDDYDENRHGYDESSSTYQSYLDFEERWNEYVASLDNVYAQYQYAYILSDVNGSDKQAQANYEEIADYETLATSQYNTLLKPVYDSAYREYFYRDQTEEEIEAQLTQSEKMSSDEYVQLETRNTEIGLEYAELDVESSDKVPTLYAELVANNNAIARMLGYDNYLEYAYADIYDREYGYKDISTVASYIKKYVKPAYETISKEFERKFDSAELTDVEIDQYNGAFFGSFFSDVIANDSVNAYFDAVEKQEGIATPISFADTLDEMCEKGAYFLGDYEGAYSWYIDALSSPVVFFGENNQDAFTFVHEFGHYFYDVYNDGNYCSTDLAETHSQGNEMLYLGFLESYFSKGAYELIRLAQLEYSLSTVLLTMTVNVFEEAVYANAYTGKNSASLMADGKITNNEYDLLYESILEDFGFAGQGADNYWRYVAIENSGYYVSYSVSMACSLQLYVQAETSGFETALDRYLKLFTYTEKDPEMTYKQALQYAGLKTYDDEALYKAIAEYCNDSTTNGGSVI